MGQIQGSSVAVFGSAHIVRGETVVPLTAAKQRRLLATLAMHLGRPLSVPYLVSAVWPEQPPSAARTTLQGYVADLRRLLEPERQPRDKGGALRTDGTSYILDLSRSAVDVVAFEDAVRSAGAAATLVPDPLRAGASAAHPEELLRALTQLEQALRLWSHPYVDLEGFMDADTERQRLTELRTGAQEHLGLFRLALGRPQEALADLAPLAEQHPLRESVWTLLALAHYRTDRQADALITLTRLRQRLAEDLGVDPAPSTRALYDAILHHDPALAPLDRRVIVTAPTHHAGDRLVGRDQEYARLVALLDEVAAGEGGRAAALLGEQGIGKTRLAAAVQQAATERGFVVERAAAIEDNGAPPLWTLRTALAALGARTGVDGALDVELSDDPTSGFTVGERAYDVLAAAGKVAPVLLVLADLHWAGLPTLRAVQHVIERIGGLRVMVLISRRSGLYEHVVASGLPATMARAGTALRLGGHPPEVLRELVYDVTGLDLDEQAAAVLARRCGGNPRFATLMAATGDPLGQQLPSALLDEVEHQVRGLPEGTLGALRVGAMLGGPFDAATITEVIPDDGAAVLDRLADAVAAGLLVETDTDSLDFAHPVVREALVALTPVGTRARLHASIAAALDARSDSVSETRLQAAYHWRMAGPVFAREAVAATSAAAEIANSQHNHQEEAELLEYALAAARHDPTVPRRVRFDLLEREGTALRWAGRPESAALVQEEALAIAERARDRDLMLRAVSARGEGVLWDGTRYAKPDESYARALSRLLRRLDGEVSPLRAMTLAALACEACFFAPVHQIDAWCAEALALASQIGDPELIRDVQIRSLGARWRPDTAPERHTLVLSLADKGSDDAHELALQRCWHLMIETELGRLHQAYKVYGRARQLAEDHNLASLVASLDLYDASWAAQSGDWNGARESVRRVTDHAREAASPHIASLANAVGLVNAALVGEVDLVLEAYGDLATFRRQVPGQTIAAGLLLRVGEVDRAREIYAAHGPDTGSGTFVGLFQTALSAELALAFDDAPTAVEVYHSLLPFTGRPASAGPTGYIGPVDAYLALAAQAMGRTTRASQHADEALALCRDWNIPAVGDWMHNWRERAAF